jgi:hypothetical protein
MLFVQVFDVKLVFEQPKLRKVTPPRSRGSIPSDARDHGEHPMHFEAASSSTTARV